MTNIFEFLIIAGPFIPHILALVWFLVSLFLFLRTPKTSEKRRVRCAVLVAASSVVSVILVVSVVCIVWISMNPISLM